ncbi:MAG: ATP-grasp domain-containing protein [Clostridia bacterium]|nr:ATP-grasp domain-containing protein [Clostridia bacterium]
MLHTNKRLLVLGATAYSINVIRVAKTLGAYVIVVDPIKNHIAKKYADKSYDIDTSDVDALYEMAVKEDVDGVFTGYSDVNLQICHILCDRLKLPFYAKSQNQILQTTDKLKFKDMCRKYNVGVVPQYSVNELATVEYPVIIKPADSYGSKGITVCYKYEETADAILKAKKHSKTSQIIIEKYLGGLDDVNIDYVMQDGKIILTAVGDRYVNTEQKGLSPLTAAVVYPSKHLDEYIKLLDSKVKTMFYEEGMHNGTVFIQSFFDGEQFYFFEMGYRVGGGQSSMMVREMCGIDYVEELINFAFTGEMDDKDISSMATPKFKKRACCLVPSLREGTIEKINGLKEIGEMQECVNITQFYDEGDSVPPSVIGNLGQSFARIHLVAESFESLCSIIKKINTLLHVKSTDGFEMILPGGFTGEALDGRK